MAEGKRESFSISTLEERWENLIYLGQKVSYPGDVVFLGVRGEGWCVAGWLFHECREVKGLERAL